MIGGLRREFISRLVDMIVPLVVLYRILGLIHEALTTDVVISKR